MSFADFQKKLNRSPLAKDPRMRRMILTNPTSFTSPMKV